MGVCTKERKGVTASGLMATPCTNSRLYEGAEGRPHRVDDDDVYYFMMRETLVCIRKTAARHKRGE